MRYHNITKDDMLNGDGLRVVLWTAGCNHCCKECQNPVTWDPNGGLPFTAAEKAEIFEQLDKSYTSGITFSGGDPMMQVEALIELASYVHEKGMNVWVYTGFTFEELMMLAEKNDNYRKALDVAIPRTGTFVDPILAGVEEASK